ncbi:hypothetical protein BSKO_10007 [Bryopsis sp. KO-2023]|nr:hypothetical protein BSKO_10007 [Bryopsis sp. KO-2023]
MCPLGRRAVGCNLASINVPRQPVGSSMVGRCRSRSERLQTKILVASGSQEPQTAEAEISSQVGPADQATTSTMKSVTGKTAADREEKVELVTTARENSQEWGEKAAESTSDDKAAKKHAQMYKQLAASRNRLSTRLSEANKYLSFMENRLEGSTATVQAAHDATEKVLLELGTLSRMVETAAAAVKFGIDKEDAIEKLVTLQSRIELAQQAVSTEQKALSGVVPRTVPVSWYGVALDVRIMGSFDNWTRGFVLSPEEMSDSVLSEFTAELHLLPGTYEVKFLVDDGWKTAPDWPMVVSSSGDTNNILVVD